MNTDFFEAGLTDHHIMISTLLKQNLKSLNQEINMPQFQTV